MLQLAEDADVPLLERAEVLRDLLVQPRRVLHGPRRRPARPGRRRHREAAAGRAHADARRSTRSATRRARARRRASRAASSHDLRPALAEHGIRIVALRRGRRASERESLDERFRRQIFPVLTPLAVGLGRPFPYISNLSLSLGVIVRDPSPTSQTFARVKVPKEMLPRFVPVGDGRTFVPLEDVIAENLDALFPGMEILDHARLPRHPRRRLHGLRRGRRPAAGRRGRAARAALRRGRARRGRRRHERGDARADHARARGRARGRLRGRRPARPQRPLGRSSSIPGYAELRDAPWTPVTQPRLQPDEDEQPDVLARDAQARHPRSTTRTTRSRPRSSASSSRPSTIPTCSRSSRPCTARATTRRWCRR